MKQNTTFKLVFAGLVILYIAAKLNEPKDFDWNPTLSSTDDNPFGASVLYKQLKNIFPGTSIQPHRIPPYNVLHDKEESNSAYAIIEPSFTPGKTDISELLNYVKNGNTVFISATDFDKAFLDTLGLETKFFSGLDDDDSTSVNFVNPLLKTKEGIHFKKQTVDGFFSKIKKTDSLVILGIKQDGMPNFVRVQYGDGYFFIHAASLCFSNYFMLFQNNSEYTAKALSYLPQDITTLHWDEYYKLGREGASTPLRFFLSNNFLTWALWLTVAALLLYVLFQMKRRQRIIPVAEPLRNTTLDFVETVSSVYFSRHDNNSIAKKKIQFWLDHIRNRYYLSTQQMDESFTQQLNRKSGVSKEMIDRIIANTRRAEAQPKVTDDLLMELTTGIDEFYQLSKN